jgi:hypothetical protein
MSKLLVHLAIGAGIVLVVYEAFTFYAWFFGVIPFNIVTVGQAIIVGLVGGACLAYAESHWSELSRFGGSESAWPDSDE